MEATESTEIITKFCKSLRRELLRIEKENCIENEN